MLRRDLHPMPGHPATAVRQARPSTRWPAAFGALVLTQAAHSVEEFLGRLWESFPPARFLTGLISADREIGFLILNIGLVGIGAWAYFGPVRQRAPSAAVLAWMWVALEVINGVVHPLWSLRQGGYTPGLATAPVLLILALLLASRLRGEGPASA